MDSSEPTDALIGSSDSVAGQGGAVEPETGTRVAAGQQVQTSIQDEDGADDGVLCPGTIAIDSVSVGTSTDISSVFLSQQIPSLYVANAPPLLGVLTVFHLGQYAADTAPPLDLQIYVDGKLVDYQNGTLTGDLTFSPGDVNLGGFLTVTNPTITFQGITYSGGTFTSGTVLIQAAGAVLFPGRSFSAVASDGADAGSLAISGSFNPATNSFSLAIDQMQLTVGDAVQVNASGVTVAYDSSNPAVDQTLATINAGTVTSPLFTGLGTVALNGLVVRKDGFHIADVTVNLANGGTASAGTFLTLTGLSLAVDDLDVAYGTSSTTITGSVTATAAGLALFPSASFLSTTATGLTATFDFSGAVPTGQLKFTAASLELTVGEALKLGASNVEVYPGSADVVATIGTVTLSSPQFSGLGTASLTNFQIKRTGFKVGSASLTTTLGQFGVIGDLVGNILRFDSVTVTVSNDFEFIYGATPSFTGTISVTATNAVLFPAVAFINKSLGNLTGSYLLGTTPTLNLDIPAFDLPIGEALLLRLGAVQLRPGQTVMLTVSNVAVESNLIGGLSGTLSSFELRRSGFSLGNLTLSATGTNNIGGVLVLSGVSLSTTNFVLDRTAATPVTGSVALTVGGLTLFPDSGFIQTSVTGLTATYDFSQGIASTGQLSLSITSLSMSIAGGAQLSAANVLLLPGTMVRQGSNDFSLSLTGSLTILDQVIEGGFVFNRTAGVMTLSATITRLLLTAGGTRILELNGSGDFLVTSNGLAGSFSLNLVQGPALADLGLAGNFQLQVNTTASSVVFGTTTIAAGPYLRVAVQSATVTVLGNAITADLFVMEKTGSGASSSIKVLASGAGLRLTAGTASLTVSDGSGAFLINGAGIAGRVEVPTIILSGVPGVLLGASGLTIELNTTGADVGPVVIAGAGASVTISYSGANNHHFVRIAGTASIDLDGFLKLSGGFAFERGILSGGGQF